MTDRARIRGNVRAGIAYLIEDSRGDLVDIEYECEDCEDRDNTILPWPAFDFGDSAAYCRTCDALINANGSPAHEWQIARFTGATTCARCGLMPLDDDDLETDCDAT